MAKEKKRFAGKGGRLLYPLLSLLLVAAALVAGGVIFFQVEEVLVEGTTKYTPEEILAVAAVPENANLLLLPAEDIAGRLTAHLPYVDKVSLERRFPTTLTIAIQECVPLAAVQGPEGLYLLDAQGKILEQVDESLAAGYIKVTGLTLENPQIGALALASTDESKKLNGLRGVLKAVLSNEMAGFVRWIDLTKETEVLMDYQGRFVVRLPLRTDYGSGGTSDQEYDRKLAALAKITDPLILGEADRGTIDLRYGKRGYFQPN